MARMRIKRRLRFRPKRSKQMAFNRRGIICHMGAIGCINLC
jgi:hypothetical protein